jgi:hypothetical protein
MDPKQAEMHLIIWNRARSDYGRLKGHHFKRLNIREKGD